MLVPMTQFDRARRVHVMESSQMRSICQRDPLKLGDQSLRLWTPLRRKSTMAATYSVLELWGSHMGRSVKFSRRAGIALLVPAALLAATITWLLVLVTKRLPRRQRIRALLGTPDLIVDLADPVDPERDHIRGRVDAPVTVLEYGDFECPYCGQAEPVLRELLREHGEVAYVWRHLPLNDVHPSAQRAAEAAEAAAEQGAFWEMHDLLLEHQDALGFRDLLGYARQLGLDVDRFAEGLRTRAGAGRIAQDVDSADLSAVSGTPTFFISGLRHYGAYDIATLSAAVKAARARELVRPTA